MRAQWQESRGVPMKKEFLCSLFFAFLFVACASTAPDIAQTATSIPTNLLPISMASQTDTPTSTLALTMPPTATPIPPTATIDLASLPTRTPQPPASCPQVNSKLKIFLGDVFRDKKAAYHDARQVVLDFLNEGGDPEWAIKKLEENGVKAWRKDITHDGIQEFILPGDYFTIFGCKDGKYTALIDIAPIIGMPAVLLVMQDLNLNGAPELFIAQAGYDNQAMYRILEWNGSQLVDVTTSQFKKKDTKIYIQDGVIYTIGQGSAQKGRLLGNYEIVDTDGNGLKDVVIHAGVYQEWSFLFAEQGVQVYNLQDTIVLRWDGTSYVVAQVEQQATPTPTPTFTPLPFSVDCSIKVSELRYLPDSVNTEGFAKSIEMFLNAGGLSERLRSYYSVTTQDLNADSVAELLVMREGWMPELALFSCQNGKYIYTEVFTDAADYVDVMAIMDNNKNGFPEIFVKSISCIGGRCGSINVIEWDGKNFVGISRSVSSSGVEDFPVVELHDPSEISLKDLDKDGIKEIVWTEVPTEADYWGNYPMRVVTRVLKWDGENYSALPDEYAAPEYRFQAAQDGDWYAKNGLYDKALKSYQMSIQSEGLRWWTEERRNYIIGPYGFGPCAPKNVTCPPPKSDPDERPVLSAYASLKSVVVYLLTNHPEDAQVAYEKILVTYPEGSPAYPITQAAVAFWESYQSDGQIANACQQVVSSLGKNQTILRFLTGGAKHSLQGVDYKSNPTNLCPFK